MLKSGVFTHLLDLAQGLQKEGIPVTIALKKNKNNNLDYCLLQQLESVGIPYFFYEQMKSLFNYAHKNRVTLIHAHSRLAFPTSYTVARKLGIPLIITLHGMFNWLRFYPATLAYAKSIIAIGPAQAYPVLEKFRKKTQIIENGININKFIPLQKHSKTDALRVIIYGRYDVATSIGFSALNESIRMLRNQDKNIEAKAIGSNYCDNIDQFETVGWVEDPLEYLQWGHIAFGHGRSLREAIATGNVGYLLGSGYGGRVEESWFTQESPRPISALPEYNLPNPNPIELASEITNMYENRQLLQSLRMDSRRIAEKYFNLDIMVKETIAVYKK